jgi:hypothetical protein
MIRAWIAVGLLAGSWMFGLDYFYPANPWIWATLVACAAVLLSGFLESLPSARDSTIALLLLVPAVIFVPWPLKIMPVLIAAGLAMHLLPMPDERIKSLAKGMVATGVILAAQSLAMAFYTAQTARSHELPKPLPDFLAGIANLLSVDAVADGSNIVMHSSRQIHRLGATWELFLDPVTFCFIAGGLLLLALAAWQQMPEGRRWPAWIRALRILTLIFIAWLPMRAGLLIALYIYRVVRAEPDRPLYVMNHFFSPWILLVLLIVPLLLIWRFLNVKDAWQPAEPAERTLGREDAFAAPDADANDRRPYALPVTLVACAAMLLTTATTWNPIGHRLGGRVKVVEKHSTWEPTTRPYDTTWYGEISGYNYAALYDYLGQYYEMSRILERDKIDDRTLSQCDVLVIKTPTARYTPDEAAAVVRFVENGGGLLLVGDHTNFMRGSTIMNDVTRPMGFIFRDDLLFSNQASAYDQHFDLPWAAHPSLQYMPPMEFAVSCSIDPGTSHGRSAITSTGLWSMPPEYHHENYHPIAAHCPEMRYGAFVQVWAAWHGRGRAMAFTDSTIFSNFAVFQPGHAELFLGMIEWLNHANPLIDPRPWLFLLGGLAFCGGVFLAVRSSAPGLVLLCAAVCAWALSTEAAAFLHKRSMPVPKVAHPMTCVVIDRTVSDALLSKGAYTQGDGAGYGMMEQLIGRLGYYTIRLEGKDAMAGDALVIICPDRPVKSAYCQELERYVAEGGRLLVFDCPENANSTANALLWPFELSVGRKEAWKGVLTMVDKWPGIEVAQACEVTGGKAVARLGERPVAAIAQHGKGSVMVVGFASLLNDNNMGGDAMWMVEPDAAMLLRYDTLYSLVGLLVENKPITPTSSESLPAGRRSPQGGEGKRSKVPLDLPELPMKEFGPKS